VPSLWRWNSDLNRTFLLDPKEKDHPLSLTFNARAANLLNHTNTTGVNTVFSPTIGELHMFKNVAEEGISDTPALGKTSMLLTMH
jgi:hypothetical protein